MELRHGSEMPVTERILISMPVDRQWHITIVRNSEYEECYVLNVAPLFFDCIEILSESPGWASI